MAVLVTVTAVRVGYLSQTALQCSVLFLFQIARLVFDLAFDNVIHVAVVAHPSLLKPEDLDVRHSFADIPIYLLSNISSQTYIAKSKAPLLINSCENDERFPKSFAEAADKKFEKFAPGYRRTYYEGVSHGFAVRGDIVRLHVFSPRRREAHSVSLCTEQADSKGCQGGRLQGVSWVADQVSTIKECPRRDTDNYVHVESRDLNVYNEVCHIFAAEVMRR